MSDDPHSDDYHDEASGDTPDLLVAGGKPMGFLDHLEDLRWTLLKCAIVFAVFAGLIGWNLRAFSDVLLWPWDSVRTEFPQFKSGLITTSPMGIFTMIINVCIMGGVGLSLPFWFFFGAQFVAPALTRKELKVLVPTCLAALGLFLAGAAFGYFFLVPSTVRVAYEGHAFMGVDPMWTADKYFGLLLWLVLGVGGAFEFPLLIVLASYMGLVEVATLRKYRRHAIVGAFIVSAIVTPTPDPFTQTAFAIPLVLLFELSIWVSAILGRRKAAG